MQYIRIVVEESEDVEGRTKMTDKVIENNQVTVMGGSGKRFFLQP